MPWIQGTGIGIFNARCPECGRFVRVKGILHEVFADRLVAVLAECLRDGAVRPVDYIVLP